MSSYDMTVRVTQTPSDPVIRFPSPGQGDPYIRLLAGICRQACYDAREGHEDAAKWLLSEMAVTYFEVLGVDYRKVYNFIDKHFPPDVLQ